MGETNIGWAHYTVNRWVGCTKISLACKFCYAEHDTPVRVVEHAMGVQFGKGPTVDKHRLPMWGGHDKRTGEGYRIETVGWEKQLRALNRKANRERKKHLSMTASKPYERPRVFINSLSDTFEAFEGPVYRKQGGSFEVVANSLDDVRKRLFAVIEECTELDILLLTKRPENVLAMVPCEWELPRVTLMVNDQVTHKQTGWPTHVWLGTTVENQEMADKRIPELLRIPARVRFLSMEPLLGEVDLGPWALLTEWVIVGGESGKNARLMHPDWARKIRDQCIAAGVPFFFKQWGEYEYDERMFTSSRLWEIKGQGWLAGTGAQLVATDGSLMRNGGDIYRAEAAGLFPLAIACKVGKKNAGRLLDGREWNEVPR